MRLTKLIMLILLYALLSSCFQADQTVIVTKPIAGQPLSFPPAFYSSVAYIDGRLIGFAFDNKKDPVDRVSYAYEKELGLHSFNPQRIEYCDRFIGYAVKGTLPDGRIGFLGCGESAGSNWSIFALNWQTGEVEQLVNGQLPPAYSAKDFTWNPQMTRGVQEMVDGAQGTIYWISPAGVSPMDIEIEDQGLKWNLKDYYENRNEIGKGVGLALSPAWSSDGKTIAFFASTYGVQEEPRLTENIQYGLYFMDPVKLEPLQVLQRITNAYRLRWSPDSEYLLFGGCIGLRLKCGLWLYSLQSKALTLVAEGEFEDFIWIGNEKVVAIRNITLPYENNEIWEYSIGPLLNP